MLKAHPSGNRASHCVGITFEVFVKAMRARNKAAGLEQDDFNGMSLAAMSDFMLRWYVAGPKEDVYKRQIFNTSRLQLPVG